MLRWFIRRRLDAEEKTLGALLDYLRYILDVSPVAFLRFASMMPFANSRSVLPKEAWCVAQIVTLRHEDCGPCLQIAINLARQSGVDTTLIRAILDGRPNDLPQEMEDVRQFTNCVLRPSGDDEALRETLRQRYGDRGLIAPSYAITSSRMPPTVKRVLGYAKSCSEVTLKTH
jgi:alkylhydroperoxidase family enzyme